MSIITPRVKDTFLVATLYFCVGFGWFYGWFHLNMQWEFLAAPIMLILAWVISRRIGAIVVEAIAFGAVGAFVGGTFGIGGAFCGAIFGGFYGVTYGAINGVISIGIVVVGFSFAEIITIVIDKVCQWHYIRLHPVELNVFIFMPIFTFLVVPFVITAIETIGERKDFIYLYKNIIPKIKSEAF